MRETIERHQAWAYLVAVVFGLVVGWTSSLGDSVPDYLIWGLLGVLLYATFTQTPLTHLSDVFQDRRFMGALLTGNFLVMPAIIALLIWALPDNDALRLGVLLVLLMPCTDWFITFTHLGKGDSTRAIAATPVLLIAQLALLPLYLWLFLGNQFDVNLELGRHLLPAFVGLIIVPLILAFLTEKWGEYSGKATALIRSMGLMPVPLLTVVLFIVSMTQVSQIDSTGPLIWPLMILFPAYLLAAALVGKTLQRVFRLPVATGRTVIFSLGTRNSFVVLPLALSMPEAWATVVVVIVVQSLVELFGMMFYLRWVPSRLLPNT
ncbi:arsenic resistance protein [Marinobacter sp. AN1]|uniref:arsenic resistance protein n=1 Tax=Marinobacter sp. AN1 TaxID=2886046 RepID=UPI0022304E51|nr:arsenic resistance protein [Marinobacter sp. AN1]UZD66220.1 arsenic resistance protein [Marinobacter sp. AN1]